MNSTRISEYSVFNILVKLYQFLRWLQRHRNVHFRLENLFRFPTIATFHWSNLKEYLSEYNAWFCQTACNKNNLPISADIQYNLIPRFCNQSILHRFWCSFLRKWVVLLYMSRESPTEFHYLFFYVRNIVAIKVYKCIQKSYEMCGINILCLVSSDVD